MDNALMIIIISVLSTLGISIFTYRKDKASEQELRDARDSILHLQVQNAEESKKQGEAIIKKHQELEKSQQALINKNELDERQQLVIKLQKENQDLQTRLNNEITGGNSLEKRQLKWDKTKVEDYFEVQSDPTLNYSFYIPYLSEKPRWNR